MSPMPSGRISLKTSALPPTSPAETPSGVLSVWIPGSPIAQGSKSARALADGRVVMWERTGKMLGPWRAAITTLAKAAHRGPPFVGAVSVVLGFWLPKPKSNRDPLPFGARTGDIDKLSRACLDALQAAGVVADDSQVTRLEATKCWADAESGVSIVVKGIGR